jgi:glycosyltransferase involved in cell wall biosynthesis
VKIVIFDNAYWNILNFRGDLVKALISKNHELIAVAPESIISQVHLENLGVTCIPIYFKVNGLNPFSDLFLCIRIFNFYSKYTKPDIVLTFTIKPNLYVTVISKLFKVKVINNISGLGSVFINESIITKFVLLAYKYVFRLSYWIFFQNQHDLKFFKDNKILNKNYSIIPGSGVNLDFFNFSRRANQGKKFLFVGRIMGEKGIRELVLAAQMLSEEFVNLEFYFVGEIGYQNFSSIPISEIEKWKADNENFHFVGKVKNIRDYYESVDIMVLPSYREGLSKSLIEASAMSLPIITTDVPGCSDVVHNGKNGFLVEVRNVNDLAEKMRAMVLLDENNRIIMGNLGREIAVNKFNVELVIKSYFETINRVVK